MPETAAPFRQRLDKWLWHARMARTRTLAARLVSEGHVRIDSRRVTDPSKKVRAGDILTLALAHATIVIEVADFAERRGSAPDARRLYKLLSAPAGPGQAAGEDGVGEDGPAGDAGPMRNPDIGEDDDALAPDDDYR
ncbi:RNA-binding S4 domain-containing protein [Pseudochelatococcus sp. B33]